MIHLVDPWGLRVCSTSSRDPKGTNTNDPEQATCPGCKIRIAKGKQ